MTTEKPRPPQFTRPNTPTRKRKTIQIDPRGLISDLLLIAGAAAASAGLWQFDPFYVLIFCGVTVMLYGALLGKSR